MTTARPATFSDSHVGEVFDGRYAVERLIGRGGMGLVYLARDRTEQREVVLKLLAPHWAGDTAATARFEREGQRLAQLSHPNIVKLLALGRSEDRSYIVMEYVDGEPLQRYLSRHRRLNLRTFAPIAAQISSAVGYVHDKSIMLRDIKPPNVMLCEHEGQANFVKLLDFGLAKMVEGDDVDVTRAHVVGTAGYLAPEQIKGEDCDVRVDVYSLGVLFFTMLTGKSPIPGDNDAAVLYHHVHGEPVRLETVLPAGHQVPPALIELVHRCLAKSPDDRPANGHAVTELLFEALPHSLFELPLATDASRTAMRSFRPEAYAVEDDATRRWSRPHLPISGVHGPEANPPATRGGAQRVVVDEGQSSASQSSGARRLPPPPSSALHRSGQSSAGLGMPSASQSSGARRLPSPPVKSSSSGAHPRPSSSHVSAAPPQSPSRSGLGSISFDPLASNEDLSGGASAPGGLGRPSLARQPSDEMVMPNPRLLGLSVLEQEGLGRRRGTIMASVGVVVALVLGGGYLALGGHDSPPDVQDIQTNGANVADEAAPVVEAAVQTPAEDEKAARALPVQIIVPSGAALRIDGEAHGKGDYRGALTSGRHDIELEYDSGQRHRETIEVRKGGELIFEVGPVQPTTVRLQSRAPRSSPPPERPTDRPAKIDPKPAAATPEQDTAENADAEVPKSAASPGLLGGEGGKQTERDNEIFLAPANSGGDKGIFLPVGK